LLVNNFCGDEGLYSETVLKFNSRRVKVRNIAGLKEFMLTIDSIHVCVDAMYCGAVDLRQYGVVKNCGGLAIDKDLRLIIW
jgi:hypothetical protein